MSDDAHNIILMLCGHQSYDQEGKIYKQNCMKWIINFTPSPHRGRRCSSPAFIWTFVPRFMDDCAAIVCCITICWETEKRRPFVFAIWRLRRATTAWWTQSKTRHVYLNLHSLTFTQTGWVQRFSSVFVLGEIEVFLNKADGCKTRHI